MLTLEYSQLYAYLILSNMLINTPQKCKVKLSPLTGHGDLQGCEMLRIPHCLDSQLTVNCEILATCSSTYSPVRTSQEAHSVSIK
jgi:hypothetical protein